MSRLASVSAAIILAVVVLTGAAAQALVNSFLHGQSVPSGIATADIPPNYLTYYQQTATTCPGLDWTILAAIGKVESDHGRSTLPGVHNGSNSAGAQGPMQIIPSTWAGILARHEIPGGSTPPSPYDPRDAAHAAALLLCDSNVNHDLRGAIFAYNHTDWYVNEVLTQAEKYRSDSAALWPSARLRLSWPRQQATMPDPTSNSRITPRTHALARTLMASGMTGDGMTCFAPRPSNPTSDHPAGRACDVFFAPHDPASVAAGWRLATWLIEHQATYAVHYIIWQGKIWSAENPRWTTYVSGTYGCPNPANLTGCHYDHIHVSIY